MLTWEEEQTTVAQAMPNGTWDSARLGHQPEQLELFHPAPLDSDKHTNCVEEDPIIIRRRNFDDARWMRRMAKEHGLIIPFFGWQRYITRLLDAVQFGPTKQVRDVLKKASQVAVRVAHDQPAPHHYLIHCPTFCPVFKFGPHARGPPRQ